MKKHIHYLSIFSDDEDGVITHDDRLRGMVIKQGDMVSFVADNLNEQIKLSSPSQSGIVKPQLNLSRRNVCNKLGNGYI